MRNVHKILVGQDAGTPHERFSLTY